MLDGCRLRSTRKGPKDEGAGAFDLESSGLQVKASAHGSVASFEDGVSHGASNFSSTLRAR